MSERDGSNGNYAPIISAPDIDMIRLGAFRFLDGLRGFNTKVYPVLGDVRQKIDNNELSNFDVQKMRTAIFSIVNLKTEHYEILKTENSPITKFIDHDAGDSYGDSIFGFIELLTDDNTPADTAKYLDVVLRDWPAFSAILEDLIIRMFEKDGLGADKRPLNVSSFEKAIENIVVDKKEINKQAALKFSISGEQGDFVNQDYKETKDMRAIWASFEKLLQKDEEVITQPGVLTNLLFNIIRNDAKEKIDANNVDFNFERDGDEMVIRVADNGVGMDAQQLDPNDERYIFNQGKASSGTDSTGMGLANAPERLLKLANAKLRVWTRKRDSEESVYSYFGSDENQPVPYEKKQLAGKEVKISTIFEVRIPITKKAA